MLPEITRTLRGSWPVTDQTWPLSGAMLPSCVLCGVGQIAPPCLPLVHARRVLSSPLVECFQLASDGLPVHRGGEPLVQRHPVALRAALRLGVYVIGQP